jgi:hypothetical protein
MLAHDVPLGIRERPGLGEDAAGHYDLADVVQPAAQTSSQDQFVGQAEPLGDRRRELRDLLAVERWRALAQVTRRGQRLGQVQALGLLGA